VKQNWNNKEIAKNQREQMPEKNVTDIEFEKK
jgi:hypothetical protein